MPIVTTNISMLTLAQAYSKANNTALSGYYNVIAPIAGQTTTQGIPTSGTISLGNFSGKATTAEWTAMQWNNWTNWADWSNPCFIKNSKILMSDGSLKLIQDVSIGDKIKGYSRNNRVISVVKSTSKDLMTFNNRSLIWTSPHPIVVNRDNRLSLWIADIDRFKLIVSETLNIVEHSKDRVEYDYSQYFTSISQSEEFITLNGSILDTPINYESEEQDVYLISTNGDGLCYINDYLVYSGISSIASHDYTNIQNLKE